MTTATMSQPTPATATTRSHFRFAVLVVAAVHLLLWTIVMIGGWLYWDDFILQGQAARRGLSSELLLNNHDGHVMPLSYFVVWVLQELSGLNYALVAVSMLVGELLLIWAAAWAFTTLLGRGWQTIAALSVFLLCPIMMPGLTWWAAALTIVPLMTCALFATVSHVRFLKTGSTSALITTFALVVVALGFFEKSVLIPGWLFLVTVLMSGQRSVRGSLRDAVAGHWRLWLGWLVLLVIYLAVFAQVASGRTRLPTSPGQVLDLIVLAVFKTLAPALVGGPLRWTPVDFSASYADPPAWLILLAALSVGAVVFAGVRHPGTARKAWMVAAVYLLADLASFAIGRLGPNGDPGVVQAGRYVATSLIPISVAVGATLAGYLPALRAPKYRWPMIGALGSIALLTLLSTLQYAAVWSKNPAQPWVNNARADLAAADPGSPLLDQDVPDFILLPVTNPYNQASWFLAPLVDQPGFAATTNRLQIIDNRGRLVPAGIDGPAGLLSGDCDEVLPGASRTISLEHPIIAWAHTVGLRYSAQAPGFISVQIGSGQPVAADVVAGQHEVFVRAEGGESSITVTSTDASMCVSQVQVGKVIPSDLPYGGDVDLADQLRQELGQ